MNAPIDQDCVGGRFCQEPLKVLPVKLFKWTARQRILVSVLQDSGLHFFFKIVHRANNDARGVKERFDCYASRPYLICEGNGQNSQWPHVFARDEMTQVGKLR